MSKVGKSEGYMYQAPELGEADRFAWQWYEINCNGFTMDWGLLPMLIKELGFRGGVLAVFILRLSLIHSMYVRIREREAKEKNG